MKCLTFIIRRRPPNEMLNLHSRGECQCSAKNPDANTTSELLPKYSDKQLWGIVHQHLMTSQESRLQGLIEQSKQRVLNDGEQAELEQLIDQTDQYMLLRSQTLLLLQERGHNIEKYLNLSG